MKALNMLVITLLSIIASSCTNKKDQMDKDLKAFIAKYDSTVQPLMKESGLAYWNASLSGKAEDWKKSEDLNIELTRIFSNKEDFAVLKKIKESNSINDELLKRQLEVLYNNYLSNQDTTLLNDVIKMQTAIEQKYLNFRAEVNGKSNT